MKYLVLVKETLGDGWLNNELFRLGASSLLNDLLMQRHRMKTGQYWGPDYVSLD
jgi:deoxyribose-phosphate aldolase